MNVLKCKELKIVLQLTVKQFVVALNNFKRTALSCYLQLRILQS